mmetsp:Transcript_71177/g.231209  ORF Transcript_71177/g.231209 Transcript_71177/m.231209 type:complete len:214 (+) Transcript_71177:90-731(+)
MEFGVENGMEVEAPDEGVVVVVCTGPPLKACEAQVACLPSEASQHLCHPSCGQSGSARNQEWCPPASAQHCRGSQGRKRQSCSGQSHSRHHVRLRKSATRGSLVGCYCNCGAASHWHRTRGGGDANQTAHGRTAASRHETWDRASMASMSLEDYPPPGHSACTQVGFCQWRSGVSARPPGDSKPARCTPRSPGHPHQAAPYCWLNPSSAEAAN